jgi:hypothetical protein
MNHWRYSNPAILTCSDNQHPPAQGNLASPGAILASWDLRSLKLALREFVVAGGITGQAPSAQLSEEVEPSAIL